MACEHDAKAQQKTLLNNLSAAAYKVPVHYEHKYCVKMNLPTTMWNAFRKYDQFHRRLSSLLQRVLEIQWHISSLPIKSVKHVETSIVAATLNKWLHIVTIVWKEMQNGSNPDNHKKIATVAQAFEKFLNKYKGRSSTQPGIQLFELESQNEKNDLQQIRSTVNPPTNDSSKRSYPTSLADYKIDSIVGRGSFGHVFLARDMACKPENSESGDTNLVAIKVMDKEEMIRRNQLFRISTERQCMALCAECPFIARLRGAFLSSQYIYLVQDFCEAGEMYYHLNFLEKFSPKVACFFTAECALALSHMHSRGIVFRDLKPENIMICEDGHIKLVDFGLSAVGISKPHSGSFSFVGTAEYFSPEMILKQGHGFAVDWWSLGMLLYEMLTGLPPWYSDTGDRMKVMNDIVTSKLVFPSGKVSPNALSLIHGLLHKLPLKRLGSRQDFKEVSSHPYFATIDFDKLAQKRIESPYIPLFRTPTRESSIMEEFSQLQTRATKGNLNPAEDSAFLRMIKCPAWLESFTFSERDL
jgi:serine/threonine protein kinase